MKILFERLQRKRVAYLKTFCGDLETPHPFGARVLADLRRFCRINRGGIVVSPVSRSVDPYATAYRAGMRDVYLRIANYLQLDESKLIEGEENDSSSE